MITFSNGVSSAVSIADKYELFKVNTWEGEDIKPLDFDVESKEISVGDITIPDKRALFRTDSNTYLATVSSSYPIIKHSDIVKRVEDGMDKYFKDASIKTILSKDGSVMQRMYTLPSVNAEIKKGDIIAPVIRIVNSYDGSTAVSFFVDAIRLVCTNGMTATKQFMSMQYKHFGNKFNVDVFAKNAKTMISGFSEYTSVWRKWTTLKCSDDKAKVMLNYLPKRLQPIVESHFEGNLDGTAWGWYNACTAGITHDYKPIRTADVDGQKIKLGADVTKIVNHDWYWEASIDDVMKDLSKKNKITIDTEAVVA